MFIPYEHFLVESSLPPQALIARVTAVTRAATWSTYFVSGKPYEGIVANGRFKITRSFVFFHDSLNPVIEGTIKEWGAGSQVEVSMRPVWPSLLVLLIISGVGLGFGVGPVLTHLVHGEIDLATLGLLIPSAFCYLIFTSWFRLEVYYRKPFFQRLFTASSLDPSPD
jgi:hypothetical protein